jgi:HEAT repeat protein
VTEELLRSLKSDSPVDRWQAAMRLAHAARSQEAEVLAALGDALEDSHPFVRWQAGLSLAQTDRRRTRAVLYDALNEGGPRRQAAAADALAYAHTAEAEPLLRALDSHDALVRQSVAEALGRLGYRPARLRLIALLEDESPWVRRAAVRALGHMGDSGVVEPLIARLGDDSVWVRRSAGYALGALRAQPAISALMSALDDQDSQVRRNAAWALGRIGDPAALLRLHALENDHALEGQVAQAAEAARNMIRRPTWQRLPDTVYKWFVQLWPKRA